MAWTSLWTAVTFLVINYVVPQLISPDAANLGAKAAFVFAGCALVGWVYSYFYLPETRGRSMVEIDKLYNSNIPIRHWSKYGHARTRETARV